VIVGVALALAASLLVPAGVALSSGEPAPPSAVLAERVDEDTVRLAWVPPAEDGGAEVEAYHVYRADDPTGPFELVNTTENTTFDDDGAAAEAGPYFYTVSAENQHGESARTAPVPEVIEMGCIVIDPNAMPPVSVASANCPGPIPDEIPPEDPGEGFEIWIKDPVCNLLYPVSVAAFNGC
jgi:hypothetical protein